jgi:large subunit ribosomal protein L9
MQVILMQKVTNLGNLGDVVKVRPGYARNFLIPQGKARRVTTESLAEFEGKRAELERMQVEELTQAQTLAARLEGLMVQIARKAGVDGRLFGSVSNLDIVDALKAQGFDVDRSSVRMPAGPLKQIGDVPVTLALHSEVLATITVSVLGEQ